MPASPPRLRAPNPVDQHVGGRLRARRKMLGFSQERLATGLSVTFQQVQKYERGANRVSASTLYQAAVLLQVPVSYFFEGLSDAASDRCDPRVETAHRVLDTFLSTPEGPELARASTRIGRGRRRRQVLELVRAIADAPE